MSKDIYDEIYPINSQGALDALEAMYIASDNIEHDYVVFMKRNGEHVLKLLRDDVNPWQPIETAPDECLVKNKYGDVFHGFRVNGTWYAPDTSGGGQNPLCDDPIEWMDLPNGGQE